MWDDNLPIYDGAYTIVTWQQESRFAQLPTLAAFLAREGDFYGVRRETKPQVTIPGAVLVSVPGNGPKQMILSGRISDRGRISDKRILEIRVMQEPDGDDYELQIPEEIQNLLNGYYERLVRLGYLSYTTRFLWFSTGRKVMPLSIVSNVVDSVRRFCLPDPLPPPIPSPARSHYPRR